MKQMKSKKGAYAIAAALLVLLVIVIALTVFPALKQTALELTGAATGHTINMTKP